MIEPPLERVTAESAAASGVPEAPLPPELLIILAPEKRAPFPSPTPVLTVGEVTEEAP